MVCWIWPENGYKQLVKFAIQSIYKAAVSIR